MANCEIPLSPFDNNLLIGTVYKVKPSSIDVNLPYAGKTERKIYNGFRVGTGGVNELVFIEEGELAVFGRITEVRLPERERLEVQEKLGKHPYVNPLGTVQLLATINIADHSVSFGFTHHPLLGARVYSAHPELVKWIFESSQKAKVKNQKPIYLSFANLPEVDDLPLQVLPEQLFGRHCAVLGATGGGKSWTIARLICDSLKYNSKMILLDASGEFYTLKSEDSKHVFIGEGRDGNINAQEVVFSYKNLTESDLFAIFRPSVQSQAPKLREAMRSLKLVNCQPAIGTDGLLQKANKPKASYEKAYKQHIQTVESPEANFDIMNLSKQIQEECIWPTTQNDPSKWGGYDNNGISYCTSLQVRIDDFISMRPFKCIFKPEGKLDLPTEIENFLKDTSKKILRVSLKNIPFNNNAREIVANAIGRYFLTLARKGKFKDKPLLVFLDEAHQFLEKWLGEESSRFCLDSFGLIAKEGRKYGLNICIATQRPRDIPEDVLSQMGTLIVHRLINDSDRKVVERASGEIDQSSAVFLPSLGPGEAMVVGVDIPVPVVVKVKEPPYVPDSEGPNYQSYWKIPENA